SKTPVVVSGVTEEQPTNSHFDFDFLISMYTNPNIKNYEWSWIWTQAVTYVKIDQATDIDQLHKDFEPMARIHAASAFQRLGMDFDEFEAEKGKWRFKVEPVRDIHLNKSGAGNRIGVISDESYIYIFSSVALLVILLAMINFMNLSTARAAVRAKEIGVRKAMGSLRNHLISQFLIESIFMSTIATLVGLGLMEMIKITTQQFVDIQFHISLWDNSWMIIMVILLPIVLGIISGLYPAFYLTRFKPSQVLKGQVKSGTKSLLFRNVLVYLQFTISITLMASTAIVYNQLQYVNNADLGFDRENVLVVNWADKLGDKIESFQNSILSRSDVQNVSISMDMIGRGSYEDVFSRDGSDKNITMAMLKVDDHFLQTMGMELIKGRAFAEGVKSDVQGIVINTAAMEALELSDEDVLGSKVDYFGQKLEIIGVVNDFNYQSLRREIAPFVFVHLDAQIWGNSRVVAVRSSSNNPSDLIDKLEQEWEKRTDAPFQYSFLDKEFENRYLSEQKLGSLFAVFTVFAMIIACLGLLGLAAYTVSQRNKEIGIRKVLGASAYRLVVMLNGNYSKLVLLSIITAVPLSWWGMSSWLEQFAYKNEISWVVYLLTGLGALAIAWITVGFQSLKAALVNPVDSLRNE
ncbi:MAG: FtsX-like permease family protein, partial [Bacteroidota bacterium]